MNMAKCLAQLKWTLPGFLLFMFVALPTARADENLTTSQIRALIAQAVASHSPEVTIPAGIYRGGPAPGSGVVLQLSNVNDLKIDAAGVLMVCTKRTRALELDKCRNVEINGLTIDYDPLTFTQGAVTAVAPDKSWIDVTIDAGYAVVPFSRIDVVDPATRYRVHGMPFLWGTTASVVQPNVVRVSLKGIGNAAPVGSLASLNSGNDPGGVCHGIDLEYCRGGIVLRNITLYCAPGMGIVEHGGAGGTRLLGDKIIPGPTPPGATQPRLLTTSWDGILHTTIGKGPDVENCTIEDCGDDSWSDQSGPALVVQSSGTSVVLAGGPELSAGDHLCRSLTATPLTVETCRSVPISQAGLDPATVTKLDDAPAWTLWSTDHSVVQIVTLDSPDLHDVGTSLYCPEHQGNGFIFRNNYVHSSGRLLIKASDGIIEGNDLIDGHNIVVDPEVAYGAAYGIENIVFKNNKVEGADNFCNAPWSDQAGAFSAVAGASTNGKKGFGPVGSFAQIDIENNEFDNVSGVNIALAGVEGVTIKGNKFVNSNQGPLSDSGAEYGINQDSIVYLRNCSQIKLAGNVVKSPGTLTKQIIDFDSTDIPATIGSPFSMALNSTK